MLREGSCQLDLLIARIERSAVWQEQKVFVLLDKVANVVNDAWRAELISCTV